MPSSPPPTLPETDRLDVEWRIATEPFVPERVFGRTGPLELEIGFGKGRFLLRSAAAHPEIDFVGIEVATEYFRLALGRAEKRGLPNLRLVWGDARQFVEELLPDRSLDRVHVYFPDPWPKRRHQKRRILDPVFAHTLARRLRPGGELRVVTDHEDYFRQILLSLGAEPRFLPCAAPEEETEGLTNYEVKYRAEGRPIYRSRWLLSGS
jgi:tRNA (guanine-N7-)-methyltransferase